MTEAQDSEAHGSEAQRLVRLVRGPTLDCRTGVLLLPKAFLGRQASLAATLNTDAADFAALKAKTFRPGARFIGLSPDALIRDLDDLCDGRLTVSKAHTDCFFVYNFDLPLAGLKLLERRAVWNFLRDTFRKRAKALVFALPETADNLLPNDAERAVWQRGGRWGRLSVLPVTVGSQES